MVCISTRGPRASSPPTRIPQPTHSDTEAGSLHRAWRPPSPNPSFEHIESDTPLSFLDVYVSYNDEWEGNHVVIKDLIDSREAERQAFEKMVRRSARPHRVV